MNNLYDFYKRQCDRWAEKELFDRRITYAQTLEFAERRAAFLQSKFSKGDVIGILAANSAEWCITYMAITSAGCIALPLDTNLSPESYALMVNEVGAKAVFVSPEYKERIPSLENLPVSLDECMGAAELFRYVPLERSDLASLVFTSGTTGKPKIVMLSHHNVITTPIATSEHMLNNDDHFICILPLFHVYAFVANFIGPFAAGCTLVFVRSLKGPDIIAALASDQFTCFPAAPQLWEIFFDSILSKVKAQSALKYRFFVFMLENARVFKALGLGFIPGAVFRPVKNIFGPRMRFFISGGAPLKKKYYNYYRAVGLPIVEGYGLTETTGPIMLSNSNANVGKKYKAGTVGTTMPGNHLKIKNRNEDGLGEVWLKGDSVSPGYYNNEQANREAFDAEGYFNTGDIGRVDRDGDLFLSGRKKNTIVLDSGKNVYPDELEAWYKQSELVADVCVFGSRIDGKETVCAVVVPRHKGQNSFDAVKADIDRLNRMIPPYKRAMRLAVSFDELPKNSTKKTIVAEVAKLFGDGFFQMSAASSGPVLRDRLIGKSPREEQIVSLMTVHLKKNELYSNNTFTDAGLDSLGLVELVALIEEKMNLKIDEVKAQSMETLEQFVSYAASCPEREGSHEDEIIKGKPLLAARTFFNPFNELFVRFARGVSRLFWGLDIRGREHLDSPNVIVAANHLSAIDVLWVYAAMPMRRRHSLFVVGKSELWFLKFVFPFSPVIFVERNGNVIPGLRASADVLKRGKSLVIFPEGTRSETGELGRFKSGAAYLSKGLGVKIVPVAITGSDGAIPKGAIIPRFFSKAKARVIAGAPVDPADYASAEELNEELRRCIDKFLKMR